MLRVGGWVEIGLRCEATCVSDLIFESGTERRKFLVKFDDKKDIQSVVGDETYNTVVTDNLCRIC